MAGSYLHVVENDGSLSSNRTVADMLENGGDVFEAVEEMYGMIWFLANRFEEEFSGVGAASEWVEEAQLKYRKGLKLSPTKRYREDSDE